MKYPLPLRPAGGSPSGAASERHASVTRGATVHRFVHAVLFVLVALGAGSAPAQFTRLPNTTLQLPPNPPTVAYTTQTAFAGLTFTQPLAIAVPPGETNRIFVVEKTGRVQVIPNLGSPTKRVFLDLSAVVATSGEEGLLGLAFHPNYASNGYFYVFYTTAPGGIRYDRLSRFSVSGSDPNAANPGSETVMIDQLDEDSNHNGGDLHFGPDGFLYISLGDEGGGNDTRNNSQRIDRDFFSGILRIDVDRKPGSLLPNSHTAVRAGTYNVPADNPFVGATSFNGIAVNPNSVRTEFWAVGLRNPWRFSFDSATGKLYCGDVGQSAREEIDIIVKGGNYGWAFREGFIAGPKARPAGAQPTDPIHDYPRTEGVSVTGGLVYRGQSAAQLYGAYIFADYQSGKVWALRQSAGGMVTLEYLTNDPGIAGFGTDPRNGDVLIADLGSNALKRLVASDGGSGTVIPPTLSGTGAFADLTTLAPHAGIVGYAPNVPFWSDYAQKTRWFSIPDLQKRIGFAVDGNWELPAGTVWIKHFELEMDRGVPSSKRRIETRFLVKTDTGTYGVTYRWRDDQREGDLVGAAGLNENFTIREGTRTFTQTWRYPSRADCQACHTEVGGHALSFNTRQLNRPFGYGAGTAHQIKALSDAGYFTSPVNDVSQLPVVARAEDPLYSVEFRARSYLTVNCSQCHQPGGPALGFWDARISTPLSQAGIINGPLSNNGGDPANRVLVPNDPAHSMILQRMSAAPGAGRMPPIGSNELDPGGIYIMNAWIQSQLKAPYGLYLRGGSTFTNYRGGQEKYLGGPSSLNDYKDPDASWYYILPNGDLYEFKPPYSNPALAGVRVAQLGSAYYNNPTRLSYRLFQRDGSYFTNYRGQQERYFGGTASANGYSDPNGFWYYIVPGGDLYEFTPPYSNPALTGVRIARLGQVYYDHPTLVPARFYQRGGSYFTNYRGQQEKYLGGIASTSGYNDGDGYWYYILPNGDLYEYTPPYTNPALTGRLVAQLGPAYYQDPTLLTTNGVQIALSGN